MGTGNSAKFHVFAMKLLPGNTKNGFYNIKAVIRNKSNQLENDMAGIGKAAF